MGADLPSSRRGDASDGNADLAAAKELEANIVADSVRFGVQLEGAGASPMNATLSIEGTSSIHRRSCEFDINTIDTGFCDDADEFDGRTNSSC
jgi:hypothetical protein